MPHAIAASYLLAAAEASSNLARYDGARYGFDERKPRSADGRAASLDETYAHNRSEGFGPEVQLRILLGTFVFSQTATNHQKFMNACKCLKKRTMGSSSPKQTFACAVLVTCWAANRVACRRCGSRT